MCIFKLGYILITSLSYSISILLFYLLLLVVYMLLMDMQCFVLFLDIQTCIAYNTQCFCCLLCNRQNLARDTLYCKDFTHIINVFWMVTLGLDMPVKIEQDN